MRLALALLTIAGLVSPAAAAVTLKRGMYATSEAGCAAIAGLKPGETITLDDIMEGALDKTDASFLEIDRRTLGSHDFECKIGKARTKGKATEWPLTCLGESSGGPTSTMRSEKTGIVSFSGGLKDWGTTYFCR